MDISGFVTPGANGIHLALQNNSSGWVYGYDFRFDGVSVDAGHCGIFNTAGCNGSLAQGIVFSHDINFVVPGAPLRRSRHSSAV